MGLVTSWAQLLITSNYYLPSTLKVQSTMRAELTRDLGLTDDSEDDDPLEDDPSDDPDGGSPERVGSGQQEEAGRKFLPLSLCQLPFSGHPGHIERFY